MPQLMPLFWNSSMFMLMYIMIIMMIFYYMKLLEFDLIYMDDVEKINNKSLLVYLW